MFVQIDVYGQDEPIIVSAKNLADINLSVILSDEDPDSVGASYKLRMVDGGLVLVRVD